MRTCTCDKCGVTVKCNSTSVGNDPPSRWTRIRLNDSYAQNCVILELCPTCTELVAQFVKPTEAVESPEPKRESVTLIGNEQETVEVKQP